MALNRKTCSAWTRRDYSYAQDRPMSSSRKDPNVYHSWVPVKRGRLSVSWRAARWQVYSHHRLLFLKESAEKRNWPTDSHQEQSFIWRSLVMRKQQLSGSVCSSSPSINLLGNHCWSWMVTRCMWTTKRCPMLMPMISHYFCYRPTPRTSCNRSTSPSSKR